MRSLRIELARSESIKVVHFVNTWLPQTCTWLHNEVRFLPEHVQNYIVCHRTENLDQFQIPRLFSADLLPRRAQYLQKLKKRLHLSPPYGEHLPLLEDVVREFRPHILHTHFGHLGWVNAGLAREHGLKQIVSFYGADVNYVPRADRRWLPRYREMGGLVDRVLCEGPYMADSIAKLGIPRDKIFTYRLGVDLTRILYQPRRIEPREPLRVLIVGTFREKKGIPFGLEALGLFQRIRPDIEITIIGEAGNNEREQAEKRMILEKIAQWNLESKVRMMGVQPHEVVLNEAYRHHIFLAPSVTAGDGDCEGGAPVSIIEMAASGMPVVSTTHCDIPYVLSPANAPYLASERDSQQICDAIERLIASGWRDLLMANRAFVEEELDARKQGRRLYEIYRDLLEPGVTQVPHEAEPRIEEAAAAGTRGLC